MGWAKMPLVEKVTQECLREMIRRGWSTDWKVGRKDRVVPNDAPPVNCRRRLFPKAGEVLRALSKIAGANSEMEAAARDEPYEGLYWASEEWIMEMSEHIVRQYVEGLSVEKAKRDFWGMEDLVPDREAESEMIKSTLDQFHAGEISVCDEPFEVSPRIHYVYGQHLLAGPGYY